MITGVSDIKSPTLLQFLLVQARSQDFCVGGSLLAKSGPFSTFLSVGKGGGGGVRGHAHPTLFLTQAVLLRL